VSFDPKRIPPDNGFTFPSAGLTCDGSSPTSAGTCSNVPSRACVTADDCVLAEQVCLDATGDDGPCYREYPIPDTKAAHLVVDQSGAVWFTAWAGGDYLGRLDPDTGGVTRFPLARSRRPGSVFGSAPWQIALAANGDVVFTEFVDGELDRFAIARLDDPACLTLDANGENPCIATIAPQGDRMQTMHSLAIDPDGRTWFTQHAEPNAGPLTASLGYVTADWGGVVLLPPLELFPCAGEGMECGLAPGSEAPFYPTGVAVDPSTGDILVADYLRRRLGRLHRVG